jgi:ACS family tartrate transporter-like MFS transporter
VIVNLKIPNFTSQWACGRNAPPRKKQIWRFAMADILEKETMRRVMLRIVPLLVVCYIISYLDRVNVGFAVLSMNRDLGFSAAIYGLGAGIFFLSYFLLEIPSNLMLHRFGARLWIARIMLTWGVLSGAMGFIPQIASVTGLSPRIVFYGIRLLLGAAEAGFFPGVIFYLTLWFPSSYRASVVGYFMVSIPLASVIGAPVSGIVLSLGGIGGLSGWQTLFVGEAIPAILLSLVLIFFLTDRPEQAAWLEPRHREWLTTRLARELLEKKLLSPKSVVQTLYNPLILALSLVYFGIVGVNYTLGFFLPSIVHDFGLTSLQTGFVAAIPPLAGAIGMVIWGRRSDRIGERKWHLVFTMGVSALSLAAAAIVPDSILKMVCFTFVAFGVYSSLPVFWTLPSAFLSGVSAAAGIAVINSLANLSGFLGPYAMGWIKTSTGKYTDGLLVVAAIAGIATLIIVGLEKRHFPGRRTVSDVSTAEQPKASADVSIP